METAKDLKKSALEEQEGDFSIEEGKRIYAIGDVHGRSDLLIRLISKIGADNERRGDADTWLVLLGDIVDRGPFSRDVVNRCIRYSNQSDKFVVIRGNHEAMMALVLSGTFNEGLGSWLSMGGAETLNSWGVKQDTIQLLKPSTLIQVARKAITIETLTWISNLVPIFRSGDVIFVHAGIRPGVPVLRQEDHDLLWIQDEFLSFTGRHPVLVVHGHTVCGEQPQVLPNRIGIDTGAYRSGILTAIGLEGKNRWFLQSRDFE